VNNKNTIALAIIAIGAIVTLKYMQKSMVPYVPFEQAKTKGGYVQIIGSVDRGKGAVPGDSGLKFTLTDKTGSIDILYPGDKPLNFDEAEKVVVIGSFDTGAGLFKADKILTKCPSKYEKK
jgi:cytochrome c-type biogenesis protein CcmE